ncbi:MAG: hypothetical protein R3B82_10280 [Sandaracinaceae bacterium]
MRVWRAVPLLGLLLLGCPGPTSPAAETPAPRPAPAQAETPAAEPVEPAEPAEPAGISCPDYNLGGSSFDSAWAQMTGCSDSTVRWIDCMQGRCECKTGPNGVDLYGPEITVARAFEPTGQFPSELAGWLRLMREQCDWTMAEP